MRKFFFLLFPLLLISCYGADELDYDGDGKIIFEGRVIDQNGVPLSNIIFSYLPVLSLPSLKYQM